MRPLWVLAGAYLLYLAFQQARLVAVGETETRGQVVLCVVSAAVFAVVGAWVLWREWQYARTPAEDDNSGLPDDSGNENTPDDSHGDSMPDDSGNENTPDNSPDDSSGKNTPDSHGDSTPDDSGESGENT